MWVMGRRGAPIAALLGLAVLAGACASGSGDGSGGNGGTGASQSAPGPQARNAATAALLPTHLYQLPSFDFSTYQALLGQLRGAPVVVNIWASWCGPCIVEAPHLADAAKRYGDRVQFVGVDILDQRGPAVDFIRQYGWTYPSVFDATGAIRDQLGILGQPATLFYDADGKLAARWSGALTPDVLSTDIDKILS